MSTAADEPLVLLEDRGGIALVLLNRPAQRNSLRYESWTELSAVLTEVHGARGVVLALSLIHI